MYKIIDSVYCTPETNMTLCVNYTEILKVNRRKNLYIYKERKSLFFSEPKIMLPIWIKTYREK